MVWCLTCDENQETAEKCVYRYQETDRATVVEILVVDILVVCVTSAVAQSFLCSVLALSISALSFTAFTHDQMLTKSHSVYLCTFHVFHNSSALPSFLALGHHAVRLCELVMLIVDEVLAVDIFEFEQHRDCKFRQVFQTGWFKPLSLVFESSTMSRKFSNPTIQSQRTRCFQETLMVVLV